MPNLKTHVCQVLPCSDLFQREVLLESSMNRGAHKSPSSSSEADYVQQNAIQRLRRSYIVSSIRIVPRLIGAQGREYLAVWAVFTYTKRRICTGLRPSLSQHLDKCVLRNTFSNF